MSRVEKLQRATLTLMRAAEADCEFKYGDAVLLYESGIEALASFVFTEENEGVKAELQLYLDGQRARLAQMRVAARVFASASASTSAVRASAPAAASAAAAAPVGSTRKGGAGVEWSDVKGLDEAKRELEEAVVMPRVLKKAGAADADNLYSRRWIFAGPPGTGKSMLSSALATELSKAADGEGAMIKLTPADVFRSLVGDSERAVRDAFALAKSSAPSVIFFDEIDAIFSTRTEGESEVSRRIKNELLVQLDALDEDKSREVWFVGGTNHPWQIDTAALRRFRMLYLPLPTPDERASLLCAFTGLSLSECGDVAARTERFSTSELVELVRQTNAAAHTELFRGTKFIRGADGKTRVWREDDDEPGEIFKDATMVELSERGHVLELRRLSLASILAMLQRKKVVPASSWEDIERFDAWWRSSHS